jgi:ATP-dependent Clp protease ATP-binding subunit ClpA
LRWNEPSTSTTYANCELETAKDGLCECREQRDEHEVIVTGDDIMHVVSKWTGVPLNRMEQKEAQKLLKMEEELKRRVIGQDEAVIAISKALRRSRADLKDRKIHAAQSGLSSSWVQPASEKRFWHVHWRSSCWVTSTL